jgi:hypothetical protein
MSSRTLFFLVLLFGVAIRAVYVLFFGIHVFPDETRFYNEIQHFAAHSSMPGHSTDMPFMAVFFGLLYKIYPLSFTAIKLINILFSLVTAVVVAGIAKRLTPGTPAATIAVLMWAVYPFFIYYTGLVLSETIFLAFLATGFLFFVDRRIVLAFLFFGLAQLTRPTVIYFLIPALIYFHLFLQKEGGMERLPASSKTSPLLSTLAAVVVFALLLSPWVIRNYQVHGVFMAGKPSGHVLWEGNNPWNPEGGVAQGHWEYMLKAPSGLSLLEQDRWERNQALNYIKGGPVRFLKTAWRKFLRFWHLWPNAPAYATGIYKWGSLLSFGPVLLLALGSLWVLRNRWRQTGILWLFFTYYTVIHMVTIGSIRYRLPLEPLLIALAAACLAKLLFRSTSAPPINHA